MSYSSLTSSKKQGSYSQRYSFCFTENQEYFLGWKEIARLMKLQFDMFRGELRRPCTPDCYLFKCNGVTPVSRSVVGRMDRANIDR